MKEGRVRDLTAIIPFYNGQDTIERLVRSIPQEIPIIIVDDVSEKFLNAVVIPGWKISTMRSEKKGYFTGAVNRGIKACDTDVLVLNQDTWFEDEQWCGLIDRYRDQYAMIGERIRGTHPAFGSLGYIHGTFMFLRRDAIRAAGLLNDADYPLWGSTAEYQWRVARKGFDVLPLKEIPGFRHERPEGQRFGSSIRSLLQKEPQKEELLVRTPPLVSVVVPCHNYGRYLDDCIHSLIGGPTSLGEMPGQTLQSFEVIIVDDASTDNSMEYIEKIVDIKKGIRAYHLEENVGTARALNYGIERAAGKYITFLSADDMREPDSLEQLVAVCQENTHSFAYDDVWLFHTHQRIKKWEMEEYNFEKLIWKNHIHAGILFPREAWVEAGGYPAVMGDGREDWAFNIALGIKGWCGVHVKNYGYLYRREGQNRTETNTTQTHQQRFLAKIMDLFPKIYEGHRPMACCGRGGNSRKNVGINSTIQTRSITMANSMVGAAGMVKIEYLGGRMSFTISGDVTNANYTFGKDRQVGWVDQRDLGTRDGKNGFLSKRDPASGSWLFRKVESKENGNGHVVPEPEAVEVQTPEPELAPEPVLAEEAASGVTEASGTLSVVEADEQPSLTSFHDPTDLNVEQIKALESQNLTREQWESIYKAEMAGRNRKGAVSYMEELLANWQD